VLLFF